MTARPASSRTSKGYKGMAMEGVIATWYARNTLRDLEEHKKSVQMVAGRVAPGSSILEVAPGPGYLAIELARLGNYRLTGLDISRTFVEIAQQNARQAGVQIDFRHGNASQMPFAAGQFDFIVCRAAFKNFAQPVAALNEMHRVLKPAAKALIIDLRSDASVPEIYRYVDNMGLGAVDTFVTKWTFRLWLLKRAYSQAGFEQLAARSDFRQCDIQTDPIGMNIWLVKAPALAAGAVV